MNKENQNQKDYNLKTDIIFKAFFSKKGKEVYLKEFLEALLNIKIKEIDIREEVSLEKLAVEEKGGRIDLLATLDNQKMVNIEMQIRDNHDMFRRTTVYSSKLISRETEAGTKYIEMKDVILINILDYEIFDYEEYISETVTVLEKHREHDIETGVNYMYIELPKFRKINPDMEDKVNHWLALIDDRKELVEMAEKKNETIRKARIDMDCLTGDAEIKRLAELREKWEMDYNSGIDYAKKEGEKLRNRKGRKASG